MFKGDKIKITMNENIEFGGGNENEDDVPIIEKGNHREIASGMVINVMEQLVGFGEEEVRLILENIGGFQLTENCNGGCYFCALTKKGDPRGVTAHYDYDSLAEFFSNYGEVFRHGTLLSSQSDVLDYASCSKGGKRDITDVLRLLDYRPFLATSIPPGSEKRFVVLAKYIMDENIADLKNPDLPQGWKYQGTRVRVSSGIQNKDRVQAAIEDTLKEFEAAGYPEIAVGNFRKYCLGMVDRTQNLKPIGLLIEKADKVNRANSFVANDGVIMTPESIYARVAVAPTIYEPTGEVKIPLKSGNVADFTPKYKYISRYDSHADIGTMKDEPMLDLVKTVSDSYLELPDKKENAVFVIGRVAMSFYRFMQAISFLDYACNPTDAAAVMENGHKQFLVLKDKLGMAMEDCSRFVEETDDQIECQKFEHYRFLGSAYLRELELIFKSYKGGAPLAKVSRVAHMMTYVKKSDLDGLDEFIGKLLG